MPPGEKPSQCAFLPKIQEFLQKKKRIWSQLFLYRSLKGVGGRRERYFNIGT